MGLLAFNALVSSTYLAVDCSCFFNLSHIDYVLANIATVILLSVNVQILLNFQVAKTLELLLAQNSLNIVYVYWFFTILTWAKKYFFHWVSEIFDMISNALPAKRARTVEELIRILHKVSTNLALTLRCLCNSRNLKLYHWESIQISCYKDLSCLKFDLVGHNHLFPLVLGMLVEDASHHIQVFTMVRNYLCWKFGSFYPSFQQCFDRSCLMLFAV